MDTRPHMLKCKKMKAFAKFAPERHKNLAVEKTPEVNDDNDGSVTCIPETLNTRQVLILRRSV